MSHDGAAQKPPVDAALDEMPVKPRGDGGGPQADMDSPMPSIAVDAADRLHTTRICLDERRVLHKGVGMYAYEAILRVDGRCRPTQQRVQALCDASSGRMKNIHGRPPASRCRRQAV